MDDWYKKRERVTISLPRDQWKFLLEESQKLGVTPDELIEKLIHERP